jgi:hypothetical protein
VDINKLSTPEKVIAASGILLLIASFLPWFTVDFLGSSISANGWDLDFLVGPLPILIGIVMAAHVIVSNFASNVNLGDLPWGKIHMIAGIIAGALLVLKLIIGEEAAGITIDRSIGMFLAGIAGIGLGVGGFLYNKEKAGATAV